jgi:DNA-binding CsgD family transcriptional regulator/PAS domain-containing protein
MSDLLNGPKRLDPSELDRLSPRERQVLSLASAGLLDKQIANELGVTLNTLRTYWGRIRAKVGEVPRSALAALFAERRATGGNGGMLGASWHIDLDRKIFSYYGDCDFPTGEMSIDELFDQLHPEDAIRFRTLLKSVEEQYVPSFIFVVRYITDHGLELASAYVEVERDEDGRATRIVARAAPIINLTTPNVSAIIGSYERDLATGEIKADKGFFAMYRLDPGERNLYDRVAARNCPEYRAAFRSVVANMVANGRRVITHTHRLCYDDGTRLWVSSHITLDYEEERPVRVRATIIAYE